MKQSPLSGQKIAILVANGFSEQDFIAMQRMGQKAGAKMTLVSMTPGLVNSWSGEGFGLNFPVDALLREALAADFDALVIPGGSNSIDKLKDSAHTKRIINGFMNAGKPVVALGESVALFVTAEKAVGLQVTGPAEMKETMEQAGATWVDALYTLDSGVMSVQNLHDQEMDMNMVQAFLAGQEAMQEAA